MSTYPVQPYKKPFRVHQVGENVPKIVDANGESVLTLMWPVHEQTKDGDDFALADTLIMAHSIEAFLNSADKYGDLIFFSEPTAEDAGETWKEVAEGLMDKVSQAEQQRDAATEALKRARVAIEQILAAYKLGGGFALVEAIQTEIARQDAAAALAAAETDK